MIKGRTSRDDIFFGLSHENIRRLRAGDDAVVDLFVLGVPCTVLITVVPADCRLNIVYRADHKLQPALAIAVPDDRLVRLRKKGELWQLHAKRFGAPFDLLVVVGETEEAIIKTLNYQGPIVREGKAAATVH